MLIPRNMNLKAVRRVVERTCPGAELGIVKRGSKKRPQEWLVVVEPGSITHVVLQDRRGAVHLRPPGNYAISAHDAYESLETWESNAHSVTDNRATLTSAGYTPTL